MKIINILCALGLCLLANVAFAEGCKLKLTVDNNTENFLVRINEGKLFRIHEELPPHSAPFEKCFKFGVSDLHLEFYSEEHSRFEAIPGCDGSFSTHDALDIRVSDKEPGRVISCIIKSENVGINNTLAYIAGITGTNLVGASMILLL